ncbi:MAG TPA: hypothetical protein VJ044_20270 [Candidatus Hodarchaeales archaeon]|nr:hypothetical protein [Candidatus Hodarchaeales archaeon]
MPVKLFPALSRKLPNNTLRGQIQSQTRLDLEVTNENILQELDAIAIISSELLFKHQHRLSFFVFWYLFAYDLSLRKKIAGSLVPNSEGNFDYSFTEQELGNIIELQSFFNNFRVQFLSDISKYLVGLYDNACGIIYNNLPLGTEIFTVAALIDKWYIQMISRYLAPKQDQEIHQKIYSECQNVLEEVKQTGLECMKRVLIAQTKDLRSHYPPRIPEYGTNKKTIIF